MNHNWQNLKANHSAPSSQASAPATSDESSRDNTTHDVPAQTPTEADPGSRTYKANCHCGEIRYTVALDKSLAPEGTGKINRCNCSICTKNGYLLVYPPRESVTFQPGSWEKLSTYRFGNGTRQHKFCPKCSSSIMIDYEDVEEKGYKECFAMNASLFHDIDLNNAEYTTFNGKEKMNPPYSVPGWTS